MSALAWLGIAAILIAWGLTAVLDRRDRRRRERRLKARVAEAEMRAGLYENLVELNGKSITMIRKELAEARRATVAVVLHAEKRRITTTTNTNS